jgi:hypothetical protein
LHVVRGGLPTPADDSAQRRFFGGKQEPQDLAWGYHFDTDSLFMRWFTDTGEWFYYEIRFLARDDDLRGLAYSFTDVTVPQLVDSVSGHRVGCKQ